MTRLAPFYILVLLSILAVFLAFAFLFDDVKGEAWEFILAFRFCKLLSLVIVAYSIAVSTILFQTITHNRILTLSIIGLDQLYLLIQSTIILATTSLQLGSLSKTSIFLTSSIILVLFSVILFRLISSQEKSLHLTLLVGIISGVFFRSMTNFLNRIIDPNEFAILQDRFFANFNTYDNDILAVAVIIVLLTSLGCWKIRHCFDILMLSKETVTNLGLHYKYTVKTILFLISTMVSVSTALVGPVTFLGLLVASLAYQLSSTARHNIILPIAILISIISLVGGQFILERIFQFDTVLSIIIEFVGGIIFIILLLKERCSD